MRHSTSYKSIRGCPELRSWLGVVIAGYPAGACFASLADVFSVSEEQVRHKTGGHCPICDGQLKR